MYKIFHDYIPRLCVPYIDDLPIKGPKDKDQTIVEGMPGIRTYIKTHVDDVRLILMRAIEVGLTFSAKKFICGVEKLKVLSTVVGKQGKEIDPDKVFKIMNWPTPTCSLEVNSFMGLCKFVRNYIEHFRHKSQSLTRFINKSVPFEWVKRSKLNLTI
jgi:hypothetical protein